MVVTSTSIAGKLLPSLTVPLRFSTILTTKAGSSALAVHRCAVTEKGV